MDRTVVRAALAALRRTVAGPDYPGVRLPLDRLRHRPRTAAALRTLGLLALLGLALVTAQFLLDSRGLPIATAWVLAILTVAPLPILLTRPLLAWRIMLVGELFGTFNRRQADDAVVVGAGVGEFWPWSPTQILVIVVVLAAVAARVDRAVLAWIGLLSLIPVWIFVSPSNQVGVSLLFVVLLILGDLVRGNLLARRALAEQAELSELEKSRRAVLEERTRIARELHDVVAHHMSMIAVQAETAPYRLAAVPDPARAEFAAIADSARAALTDMRRLLGVLRSESEDPRTAPQPGLADLPALVAAARRAGMAVTLDTDVAAEPSAPVELAAYRIVQEGLANAARHAGGAAVRVTVRDRAGGLAVRVQNTAGGTPAGPDAHGGGQGLVGMRERAVSLGGSFTACPTTDGGYAIDVLLPDDAPRPDEPPRVDHREDGTP
ncbi:Signal transduction histidine kinase [Micromonospora phaseoli]|uniref:histidine kinase n=1 Tax=Micromonospora phaseoli TaxID=1144548 RepID=A0A1H7DFP7_9ACTN|nr:histidine kinase [Micromonospora phaseoli]PZV90787.1 signal transduction histidine kinase [Micromonospora phaseoli]GIJ77547.1 two-component sensor histidine kinase [Micromonospora phaseoli]SEJ97065.1 Signal transduction histidine kinase [Micromonospora phaseoli]